MAQRTEAQGRNGGFTLVELMIVVSVLVPILAAIGSSSGFVGRALTVNEANSEVRQSANNLGQRITRLVRPGKLSTFKVLANQADVTAGDAAAVGDWIDPTDLVARSGLQFVAAEGTLSLNAALDTTTRAIRLELEDGEVANGTDDDGDGLIDEGRIILTYEGLDVPMSGTFERCEFETDGRRLRMRLQAARVDREGNIHRVGFQKTLYIRNN